MGQSFFFFIYPLVFIMLATKIQLQKMCVTSAKVFRFLASLRGFIYISTSTYRSIPLLLLVDLASLFTRITVCRSLYFLLLRTWPKYAVFPFFWYSKVLVHCVVFLEIHCLIRSVCA